MNNNTVIIKTDREELVLNPLPDITKVEYAKILQLVVMSSHIDESSRHKLSEFIYHNNLRRHFFNKRSSTYLDYDDDDGYPD